MKDGSRTLQFTGDLVASSSSKRPGVNRWVEFELYKTASGKYVLGRTGHSDLFHDPGCAVVARNDLQPGTPGPGAVGCDECMPAQSGEDYVCVETPRHWAQVSDSAAGVLEALYKYDEDGTRYLTVVARKLIERASRIDKGISKAYSVEHVY